MKKKKGKKGKYTKAKKIVLGILIGYVALMVLGYIAGVVYFTKHFYLGSQINGMNASGKSVEDVEDSIVDEIASYTLKLKERDGKTESIVASQINMQYVDDGKIQELKDKQNPFLWFLSFAHQNDYDMSATTTYDKDMLYAAVDALDAFQEANITQPADAYLGDTDTGYEIVPEVMGNALDKDKVKEQILKAIDGGKTELDLEAEDCYLKPTVYSTDENLIKQRDQSNAYLGVTVTFDFSDRQEVVNKDVIKNWLTTDENGDVVLDEEKAKEFVVEMAKKYNIKLEVLSSFTGHPGTKIKGVAKRMEKTAVSSVAKDKDIARIALVGVPNEVGTSFKVFSLLAQNHINVDIILQGIGHEEGKDICFTVAEGDLKKAAGLLESHKAELRFARLETNADIAKVSVVGSGMINNPGVAAKLFEALYDAHININMISTSEIKISVLVDKKDADRAVQAVHDKFFAF